VTTNVVSMVELPEVRQSEEIRFLTRDEIDARSPPSPT